MERSVRISVRNLVEFILRSGDIDQRRGAMAEKDAMQMGSRIHRKIQGRMGLEYQAEVPLSGEYVFDDCSITVEGRADGVIRDEQGVVIDEIKGIFRKLEYLEVPVPVHLAQAKCYACILGNQEGLERIGVQMTYCHLETEELKYFREEYSLDELNIWFQQVVGEYRKWAVWEMDWKEIRQASVRRTEFPYPYREGQRDLAAAVYRTIARKKKLFIQAPTGTGKTLTTVFPAVKAVGEELGDKIFYLTAKTIARTVAEDAFRLLQEQGLKYKVITLTAKEKICRCEQTAECNPDACPYARGHYDRINDAVFDMLNSQENFGRKELEAQADKWMVCPFELSLDVSLWMDAVICDYNYVFDPRAHLKRFFSDGVKGDYLFLIDEAHNLVERGRDMFSAELYKEDFLTLKRMVKDRYGVLARALERCNRFLLGLKRECDGYEQIDGIGMLPVHLMNLSGELEKFLEETHAEEIQTQALDLYFQVQGFLGICDRLDDCYVIYTEQTPDNRFMLRLYCVDPSVNLQDCLNRGNSTIYFSATLLPIEYYRSLLSRCEDDYAVYAKTCFDPGKMRILIGRDTSSRYRNRSPETYRKIAAYIEKTVQGRRGNYLIFFPSYRMLEDVADCCASLEAQGIEIVKQTAGMTELRREEFLQKFSEGREKSLVGFCIMGSIFGEGIDLKNDRLIGTVVVGTGLPQVCCERELLKRYYDERGRDGFGYAYVCPGMNKVLQAAGRVIRTEEDRGVVLLLDERFMEYRYRSMFPREWENCSPVVLGDLEGEIKNFWDCIQS